jgi:protein-tyrosine phosphatase
VHGYLKDRVGLTDDSVDRLRSRLLTGEDA